MAIIAAITSRPGHGTLIEVDYYTPGDKLITRDTDTGLEWLDLTASTNLSVNDVLGGAGDFLSNGFTYATEAQIRAFWINAGIPVFNTGPTTPGADPAGRIAENFAPIAALMTLIGCTGNCASAGPDFSQGKAALNEIVVGGAQSPFVEIYDGKGRAIVGPDVCCAGFDSKQPSAANWLVRPFAIPEPPTFAMLIVALIGLGFLICWQMHVPRDHPRRSPRPADRPAQ